MAFQKRQSAILKKASARLQGVQSLHANLDLGNGLTTQQLAALIELANTQLQDYHLALAEADRARIEFEETEASVSSTASRILSAIAAQYGKDSKEYELAGGKPRSSSKRTNKQGTTTNTIGTQSNSTLGTASSNGAALNGATVIN